MYKQAIVVRKDLEWTKGKIAAHVAHAAVAAALSCRQEDLLRWNKEGAKKVVLKVENLQKLKELYTQAKKMKLPCSLISDAGKTQLKKGTITALAIGPADEKLIDKITGKLKLL
jgi:PTH2 family peptidyl-tRNA hydrolase